MKSRLFMLVFFLALPGVEAAPQSRVSSCDVQMQIRDGRDAEGLAIPGQSADIILPCITKDELARIIEGFNKGDTDRRDKALDAMRRAKQFKLVLTPEIAMREKD